MSALSGDTVRKNKWLARLSPEKRRNVLRVESSLVMREVRDSLDALIPFTGLWPALEIGQFQRILVIHCPEVPAPLLRLCQYSDMLKEMARYLSRIKHTWSCIIGKREDYQHRLDASTVNILQGRCPFRSLDDRTYVEARLLKGDILPAVISSDPQINLLQNLMSVEHTIPSIYTFLEDTKYLEPCARILKDILPTKCKGSLAQAFHTLHNGQLTLKEQMSAFSYRHRNLPTGSDVEWLAYRQLWLLPLRHFPTPKKDSAKWKKASNGTVTGKRKRDNTRHDIDSSKAARPVFRRQWLRQLALLASANGYRLIKQVDREPGSADADMAKDFILNVRPPNYYQLGGDRLGRKIQLVCQVLEDIEEVNTQTRQPEMTSDYDDCGSDIEDRCGRPQEHSVEKDEENLLLNHIYPEALKIVPKKYMTSFAWKRDMFHLFFGSPEIEINRKQRSEEQSSKALDSNVREGNSTPGTATISITIPEKYEENLTRNDSVSRDLTQSTPRMSSTSSAIQTNSTQLVVAHSVRPAHLQLTTGETRGSVVGQREQDTTITLADVSRLLFDGQANGDNRTFTVLSLTKNSAFHRRTADPHNKAAVIAALRLSPDSHFISRASGRQLKLTDPRTVVEEAHSEQLGAVLSVPRHGAQELVCQLESNAELGDVVVRKSSTNGVI